MTLSRNELINIIDDYVGLTLEQYDSLLSESVGELARMVRLIQAEEEL